VLVLAGRGSYFQTFFFIIAASILVFTASIITWQNQIAFKYAQASNIIPVAQVPIQISPVLFTFSSLHWHHPGPFVFLNPHRYLLTIIAGFLLGQRPETPLIPKDETSI